MDISSLNIPIYYINLKEKTERNNKIIKLFKEHNVTNYTRIEAFSYKNYNIEKTKQKHPCPGTNRDITLGEQSCFTSHILTLKKFVERDDSDYCFVFEDDINFNFEKYYCQSFSNYIRKMPENTDILQLHFHASHDSLDKIIINPNFYIRNTHKYAMTSTAAYLISKKYAIKLLRDIVFLDDNIIDFSELLFPPVYDWYLFYFTDNKYTIPLISINCDNDSSINPGAHEYEKKCINGIEEIWKEELENCKKKLSNLPTIFYINRLEDVERRKNMEKMFKRFDIKDFRRIQANTENTCFIRKKDNQSFDDRFVKDILDAEYAVTTSHLKCLLLAKKMKKIDKIIIMEDDCCFGFVCYYNKNFNDYISELNNYNYIRLVSQGNPVFNMKNTQGQIEKTEEWRSNAGYLITKEGIDIILNNVKIIHGNLESGYVLDNVSKKDILYDFENCNYNIIADILFPSIIKDVYNIPLITLNFASALISTINPNNSEWPLLYLKEQKYVKNLWEKQLNN